MFYGHLDRNRGGGGGGGGGNPSDLTVSICEKIDIFSFGIWFFDSQIRFHLMVKGLFHALFVTSPLSHT